MLSLDEFILLLPVRKADYLGTGSESEWTKGTSPGVGVIFYSWSGWEHFEVCLPERDENYGAQNLLTGCQLFTLIERTLDTKVH
jgi:hypothetical protein